MSCVAVVTSSPPVAEGGHLVIARALVQALREHGHDAHLVTTPQNPFGQQASAYLATWLTNLRTSEGRRIDRVISLRYPSYAVRHPRHVCWLNHTMREYYDLWDRWASGLTRRGFVKERVRKALIHGADHYLLAHHVRRLFVISRTVQQRLAIWPSLRSTVLYPPAPQRPYRCEGYGDYVFMVSRLTPLKRADLLVRALATPEGAGVRAVIAGDGDARPALAGLIRESGVGDRVTLLPRLSDTEMLDHLARCRAVCFPPYDEDYGFVTVEAFASRKAVVTCRDSGGPAELVVDGTHGIVCEPTAASLGGALRRLMDDQPLAERMGAEAYRAGTALTWSDTVRQLLDVE
ncbi:MAG TPA: glycosyltransferase family 4 protein [Vicinamibacterales bacterium]|nr:glycosyltransferase family 4 protein [Vicinamibacterales bacterium]